MLLFHPRLGGNDLAFHTVTHVYVALCAEKVNPTNRPIDKPINRLVYRPIDKPID